MGNWFTCGEPTGMSISPFVVNPQEEGNVYLLQYKIKPEGQPFSAQRTHYTLIFDCAGESTEKDIKGQEVHLLVKDLEKGDLTAIFEQRVVIREKERLYGSEFFDQH
jgi:hypothetical protein